MNDNIIIKISDDDYLEKSLKFIKEVLIKRKVSKTNAIRAELLAEENIVLLAKNASTDAALKIKVTSFLGDVSLELKMKGQEFDPADDDDEEEAVRSILLRAYGEKFKYTHKNGENRVRILVVKAEQTAVRNTVFAMVLGLIVGLLLKDVIPVAVGDGLCTYLLRPIKTMFMSAIKIVIAPVVFFSLVTCISQFKNLAELGRLAAKVMGFYTFTTVIATALGFSFSLLFKAGEWGFALKTVQDTSVVAETGDGDFSLITAIVNIVPSNFVKPFVEADTLQVMFLALLVGVAVGMIGEYSTILKDIFEACNSLFLTITTMIAKAIPFAVFCSISLMIVDMGGASLVSVLTAALVQVGTIFVMICVYGVLVLVIGHLNPFKFFGNIKEGMVTSLTLSSSSAAMPTNLRICKEKLGISPKVCNFSIPLGATVNMDGTCIFLTSFVIFLARAYGVEVTAPMIMSMTLSIILLSFSAPGVPGSSLICIGVLLGQIGVPVEAIGLILPVNPLVDMFDTMNNTTGDMAGTLLVAKSEKLFDIDTYNS